MHLITAGYLIRPPFYMTLNLEQMIWLFIVCWIAMLATPAIAIMAIILSDYSTRHYLFSMLRLYIKCGIILPGHFHFRYYFYYEEQEYYRDERRNEQE